MVYAQQQIYQEPGDRRCDQQGNAGSEYRGDLGMQCVALVVEPAIRVIMITVFKRPIFARSLIIVEILWLILFFSLSKHCNWIWRGVQVKITNSPAASIKGAYCTAGNCGQAR
jgi:hypothetical protein